MRFSKRELVSQGKHRAVSSSSRNVMGLLALSCVFPLFFFYLDSVVILWVKSLHETSPPLYSLLGSIDPLISVLGYGATLIIASLILYGVGRHRSGNLQRAGKTLFVSLISTGVIVQVLKHLSGRARPSLTDKLVFIGPSLRNGYDSFPSGHTAMAFCLASVLSQYFPSHRVAFYAFAVVIGVARVKSASHFPSDVLAGAAVGMLAGKVFSGRMTLSARSTQCPR